MSNNGYRPGLVLLLVAAALASFVAGRIVHSRLDRKEREPRLRERGWTLIIGSVGVLMVGVTGFFAWWGAYLTTWDSQLIKWAAFEPSRNFTPYLVDYFSRYPNNHAVLMLGRIARQGGRIGLDYEAAFALINTAALALAGVAMVATVRILAGPRRALAALVALFVLVGLSPWVSVPYTDMPAIWIPMVAVFLFVLWIRAERKSQRVLAALGYGAVLAIGYVLKVTPVVGMVSVLLALLVAGNRHPIFRTRRLRLVFVALSVIAFLVTVRLTTVTSTAVADLPPLDTSVSAVPLAYVAAGIRLQHSASGRPIYGGFDQKVNGYTWKKPHAVQNRVSRQFIDQALSERGPVGTARFMTSKMLFNWGDGMFWARGEGQDEKSPLLRHGWQADLVAAVNAPNGVGYATHVHVAQALWILLLISAAWGLLTGRCRQEVLLMALTIAGIAAFTLVFQGRSRYLLGHAPVMIALALTVLPIRRLGRGSR
ncbi:MAG TPA: hypothetical protein VGD34_26860 [Kribbella sp.]